MTFDVRAAEVDNDWRHLQEKAFSSKLDTLGYSSLSCLEDGETRFLGGLTAIIGANGVGKSAFLAALAKIFHAQQSSAQKLRTTGSYLSGRGSFRGDLIDVVLGPDHNGAIAEAASVQTSPSSFGSIDPSFTPWLVQVLHDDAAFNEVLEGLTAHVLDADELLEISYLVKKKYTSCQMFEIDDYRGFDPFPYFRVAAGGRTYTSEAMGLGELALLHHFWLFRRLGKNSVMILEEPETYLSPSSQVALMNVAVKRIQRDRIWTVMTTHSPTILRRVKEDHIKLITQQSGHSIFVKRITRKQIEDLLGEGTRSRAYALVEDEGARALLKGILTRLAPEMLSELQVISAGDENKISQVITALPKLERGTAFIGVFDGNLRDAKSGLHSKWPACFLPGNQDPDAIMQDMMASNNSRQVLATRLNRRLDEVRVACDALDGENYHNWPIELARRLSSDIFTVRDQLVATWLDNEANQEAASELVSSLRGALLE